MAAQCIKSSSFRSRDSVNVHIRHGEKCDLNDWPQLVVDARWAGLSISYTTEFTQNGGGKTRAYRKSTVTLISTLSNNSKHKTIPHHSLRQMGYNSIIHSLSIPFLSAKKRTLKLQTHQNWAAEELENIVWLFSTLYLIFNWNGLCGLVQLLPICLRV